MSRSGIWFVVAAASAGYEWNVVSKDAGNVAAIVFAALWTVVALWSLSSWIKSVGK